MKTEHMNKNRKYTTTLAEAKKLYKLKTGCDYVKPYHHHSGVLIYALKIMQTKTRRYFVGTYIEWLNL